jgi:diguanylate cyclase (GGDEF)-like protein
MLELNATYREDMAYRVYAVIGLLILPFSLWALSKGNYWLGIPPALTAILSLFNVGYHRAKGCFLFSPVLISLMYIGDNVLVIAQIGPPGVLWAYPTMLALYWVHSPKIAQQIVPLLYVSVCFSAYMWLPLEYVTRVVTTLFMMGVFFHIASGLMEQQYQDVKRLTITDHLTGAYNRRFMDSKIDELIERQKRSRSIATMVTLDVDHFKSINDHFGHSSGDKVLMEIVQLLNSRVRVLDKVCRAGGEEFVILLPDTSEQAAYTLAEDIRRAISESNLLNQGQITISCGIAVLLPNDNRDSWLKRSDQALYKAKESGRNKVVVGPTKAKDAFA